VCPNTNLEVRKRRLWPGSTPRFPRFGPHRPVEPEEPDLSGSQDILGKRQARDLVQRCGVAW